MTPTIGLFIIPLFLLSGFISWNNYNVEKEDLKKLQHKLTLLASENLSYFLHEQEILIRSMLRTNYSPDLSHDELKSIFSRFLSSFRDIRHGFVFSEVAMLNPQGKEILRVSRKEFIEKDNLRDRSNSEEFLNTINRKDFYYTPIKFKEKSGEPLLQVSIAVRDLETQAIQGVFVAEMRLNFLWDLIADMKIGEQGATYLVDNNGRVIAHSNGTVVLKNTIFNPPENPQIRKGISGQDAIIAAKKINFGGQLVTFVTEVPTSEALKHVRKSFLLIGSLLFLTLLGAIVLGFVIGKRIVKPIEKLADTARKITEGDLNQKAETGSMDELGDLATAFNTMTARLVDTIQEVKSEKDFVKNVIESMTDPFYVINVSDHTIKLANSAANFGSFCSETDTCYKLTHHSDAPCSGKDHPCTLTEIKKTGEPVIVEHVHITEKDKKKRIFQIYGFPIFDEEGELTQVIEHNIDITEKKNLEHQLMQSQKLEAVGILTGGVAHDFNNLLTTILGYSEILLMNLEKEDPNHNKVKEILEAGKKAAALTRQLLAFSRKQVMEIKVVNFNILIENALKMLNRLIGEQIKIKTNLKSPIPNIMADPTQLEQIIMNLAVNARDAMPEGGVLYFETDMAELDREYCLNHPELVPGKYVVFCATDTGKGMSPEVQEHIFDPFYTTKKKGKGTGLGLSTVYGIVKQLKGSIIVYSESGMGTTFKILFPLAEEDEERGNEKEIQHIEGGTETVMVVDDEPSIRQLVCDTLSIKGYQVICAESGEEALDLCRIGDGDHSIKLLLTDVIMPGMNGRVLSDKMQENYPDLKVIFMSGYTDDVITHHGVLDPGLNFINKPLIPSILSKKIREILDS